MASSYKRFPRTAPKPPASPKTAAKNAAASEGHDRHARINAMHRDATTSPRTITSGGNTADGFTKSSAKPTVGNVGSYCVEVGPRAARENLGK